MAAVDLNNELRLYDIIMVRPETHPLPPKNRGEFAEEIKGGDEFGETLKKSIVMYENLLIQQRVEGDNTSETEKMILTLRQQLPEYRDPVPRTAVPPSNSLRTSQAKIALPGKEKRTKALEEIFHFYTKQCANAHVKKTFEDVQGEINTMNLGYFLKLIKDFDIPVELKANIYIKTFHRKRKTFLLRQHRRDAALHSANLW